MPTPYRKPQPYRKARTYRGDEVGVLPVPAPGFSKALRAPYEAEAAQAQDARLPWEGGVPAIADSRQAWSDEAAQGQQTRLPSMSRDAQEAGTRAAWGDTAAELAADTRAPWRQRDAQHAATGLPWADIAGQQSAATAAAWSALATAETAAGLPWGAMLARSLHASMRWRALVARGALLALPWGPSGRYQGDYRNPWPNDPTDPNQPGWDPLQPPILPVYAMIPSVSAVVLPARTPLDVLGINVGTDAARYLWQASLTIPIAALPLVSPATGPVDIEISINGYVWVLRVTSFSDRRRFGSKTATIEAASRSIGLAQPASAPSSRIQTATRDASQLGDEELATTGWTLLWDTVDWSVPGGTWSYADLAPIEALVKIAEAVGARVETERATLGLRVAPRYPVSPWVWGAEEPWAILPAEVLTSRDGGWQDGPNANGIYVYGEGGYGAQVLITGTAGEVPLPMRVERLITAADAARELGRQSLAAAGKIKRESLSLPLFPSPADPGLLPIGALIDVQESPSLTWRGQVQGVQITAQRNGGAVSVRQQITVERQFR